jgi:hypothetical protein
MMVEAIWNLCVARLVGWETWWLYLGILWVDQITTFEQIKQPSWQATEKDLYFLKHTFRRQKSGLNMEMVEEQI